MLQFRWLHRVIIICFKEACPTYIRNSGYLQAFLLPSSKLPPGQKPVSTSAGSHTSKYMHIAHGVRAIHWLAMQITMFSSQPPICFAQVHQNIHGSHPPIYIYIYTYIHLTCSAVPCFTLRSPNLLGKYFKGISSSQAMLHRAHT